MPKLASVWIGREQQRPTFNASPVVPDICCIRTKLDCRRFYGTPAENSFQWDSTASKLTQLSKFWFSTELLRGSKIASRTKVFDISRRPTESRWNFRKFLIDQQIFIWIHWSETNGLRQIVKVSACSPAANQQVSEAKSRRGKRLLKHWRSAYSTRIYTSSRVRWRIWNPTPCSDSVGSEFCQAGLVLKAQKPPKNCFWLHQLPNEWHIFRHCSSSVFLNGVLPVGKEAEQKLM